MMAACRSAVLLRIKHHTETRCAHERSQQTASGASADGGPRLVHLVLEERPLPREEERRRPLRHARGKERVRILRLRLRRHRSGSVSLPEPPPLDRSHEGPRVLLARMALVEHLPGDRIVRLVPLVRAVWGTARPRLRNGFEGTEGGRFFRAR